MKIGYIYKRGRKNFFTKDNTEMSSIDLRFGEVDLKIITGVSPRHVTLVKLKREGKKARDAAEGLGSMVSKCYLSSLY